MLPCSTRESDNMKTSIIAAAFGTWGLTFVACLAPLVGAQAVGEPGRVVAWGYNSYGQANVPSSLTNVVAIAAGYYHRLALQSDGRVVAWGRNDSGQTNVPSSLSNVVAIAAGGSHSLALWILGPAITARPHPPSCKCCPAQTRC